MGSGEIPGRRKYLVGEDTKHGTYGTARLGSARLSAAMWYLDEWWVAALQDDPLADQLDERLRHQSGELAEIIDHAMRSMR